MTAATTRPGPRHAPHWRRRAVVAVVIVLVLALGRVPLREFGRVRPDLADRGASAVAGSPRTRRPPSPPRRTDKDKPVDTSPYLMPDYETVDVPEPRPGDHDQRLVRAGRRRRPRPAVVLVHGHDSCKREDAMLLAAGMLHKHGIARPAHRHAQPRRLDGPERPLRRRHARIPGRRWRGHDWLVNTHGFAPNRVGLLGMSLGRRRVLIATGEEPQVAAVWVGQQLRRHRRRDRRRTGAQRPADLAALRRLPDGPHPLRRRPAQPQPARRDGQARRPADLHRPRHGRHPGQAELGRATWRPRSGRTAGRSSRGWSRAPSTPSRSSTSRPNTSAASTRSSRRRSAATRTRSVRRRRDLTFTSTSRLWYHPGEMSPPTTPRLLRINEVAAETGLTTRAIRYYEEIGPPRAGRPVRRRLPPVRRLGPRSPPVHPEPARRRRVLARADRPAARGRRRARAQSRADARDERPRRTARPRPRRPGAGRPPDRDPRDQGRPPRRR